MAMSKEEIEKLLNNAAFFNPIVNHLFEEYDKDKSGFIDLNEFYNCIVQLNSEEFHIAPPKKEDVLKYMDKLDKNSDGKISKEEFRPFIKEILTKLAELGQL